MRSGSGNRNGRGRRIRAGFPNDAPASRTGLHLSKEKVRFDMKHHLAKTIAAGVLTLGVTATATQAQSVCGPRDAVLERLSGHYGESRRGMGLGSNNGIVEVFASDETGTWTITVTMPDGRMCLVASGESYEDAVDPLKTSGTGI